MKKNRYKLPKEKRLVNKKHFEQFFAVAKRKENIYLRIYFAKAILEQEKVAFIAGKKIGNAVYRNTSKRRLREIFRLNQQQIPSGFDLVLVAKKKLNEENFKIVQESYIKLLKLCKLYKK